MTMVRVWNVTDDAHTDVVPHTRMVLGKVIKPGRSVLVDAGRLEGATKVKREVDAGFLFVGDKLPAGYVKQKRPPRAEADARIIDSKGHASGEKIKVGPGHAFPGSSSGGGKVVLTVADPITIVDHVEVSSSDTEAQSQETPEESGQGRRRRR